MQIENISNWSDFMSIHSHLYLKSGLGSEFCPGICLPRPDILSAGIEQKTTNRRRHLIEDNDESNESDIEVEEFIYNEASSSDESEEDDIGFEDATQGEFVLYRFTEDKYYVAAVVENTTNHVVLSCKNSITFVWPSKDDVVVDIQTFASSDFKKQPFPTFGRRGSISFHTKAFGKIPLSRIQ